MDSKADTKKIIEVWDHYKRYLSINEQERVKSRVLSGWGFERAIRNEGIILLHIKTPMGVVQEMFKSGDLTISEDKKTERVAQNITKKEAGKLGVQIDEASNVPDTVYEKTPTGFIPRPKNKK